MVVVLVGSAIVEGPIKLAARETTPMPNSSILATIARLSFVFAKTMPTLPHEYTERRKAKNDADYVALYEAIMHDGTIEWWRRRPARYLYPGDGWRYWSMSPKRSDVNAWHPLYVSRHINRHRIEDTHIFLATGLFSLVPPQRPVTRFITYPDTPAPPGRAADA
jgi:hypothetical protein